MDRDQIRAHEVRCPTCGGPMKIVKEVPSGTMGTKTAYIVKCEVSDRYWHIDFDGDGRMIIEERLDCDLKLLKVAT